MKWWREFRQRRTLERALLSLDVPVIPEKVRESWLRFPEVKELRASRILRLSPWMTGIMIMIATLLANGGVDAFAQVVRDTQNPKYLIGMNPGKWFSDLTAALDGITGVSSLMVGVAILAVIAAIMIAVSEKRKTGEWPAEAKMEKLNWFQFGAMGFVYLLICAKNYADVSASFKIGAALILPGISLAYILAMIVMSVVLQIDERDPVRSVKQMIYTLISVMMGIIINATFVQPILHGLSPVFWWIGVALAVALTPVLIRLGISAGYFCDVSIREQEHGAR